MTLKIGIIGCGNIGQKRAKVIQSSTNSEIFAVADTNFKKAQTLGQQFNCKYFNNWNEVLQIPEIDAVVVSTTNNSLAKISLEAAKHGKHIFCEKPLGISILEVKNVINETIKQNIIFKAGLTLRFHPGIQKLREVVADGKIGSILFIRCNYGITGRPGYEKEWRADPNLSGGGELIDQGIHVLDLFRIFLGKFEKISGSIGSLFWESSVEDNAMVTLTTKNQLASLHVSWTQWDNLFSFEIYGTEGYAKMNGLGGVYGKETVIVGEKAPPEKWPPHETLFTFENPEQCWSDEWDDFVLSIINNSTPNGSGKDGLEALKLVFRIYDFCKK